MLQQYHCAGKDFYLFLKVLLLNFYLLPIISDHFCFSFLPKWTSDSDLIAMAQKQGVKDIVEVKFAENRSNGQSKG